MNKDPKGYYATLGVKPSASSDEIRQAFRRRAMELHPDRNASANATKDFQRLNEAYAVLSSAGKRAEYDSISVNIPDAEKSSTKQEVPEPIVCSKCSKITAQPRYVVFYSVVSYIFGTTRSGVQGIFCRACADKESLKASIVTWLLGWWGIPWGPIYSLHAILNNLIGGVQAANINARLLAHQAWYFAFSGNVELARAIAMDALELATKIKSSGKTVKQREKLGYASQEEEKSSFMAKLGAFIGSLDDGAPIKRLKSQWGLFGRGLYQQAGVLLVVTGILVWGPLTGTVRQPNVASGSRFDSFTARRAPEESVVSQTPQIAPSEPAFERPPQPLPVT